MEKLSKLQHYYELWYRPTCHSSVRQLYAILLHTSITVRHGSAYTVVKGDERYQWEMPFFGVL